MPNLNRISITFNTLHDAKDSDTLVYVFVKNWTPYTRVGGADFISNFTSFERFEGLGTSEINPFLAFGIIGAGDRFEDPSSNTVDIPLRTTPIPLEEVYLPVINISILPAGDDRWAFSYEITFFFDDGTSFPGKSNVNGVRGIVLDQDNRHHSGITVENPLNVPPPFNKPDTDAVLSKVVLLFNTTKDGKDSDTVLNVHIVNRLSEAEGQDIGIASDVLKGVEFTEPGDTPSINQMVFSSSAVPVGSTSAFPLASKAIKLRDFTLPMVNIQIVPNGDDQWIFDYKVFYYFSNGMMFSSATAGVILDQDFPKHMGAYQGPAFPAGPVPTRPPLSDAPASEVHRRKTISLSYVQQRLVEFVNDRQGGAQPPPIRKILLHHAGGFRGSLPRGSTKPESYYDLQSLVADPPPPGTLVNPGFAMPVTYNSHRTSLGQLGLDAEVQVILVLNNIASKSITANIDPSQPAPLTVDVEFDTSGVAEVSGDINFDLTHFSVTLALTLTYDPKNKKVDVLSWMDGLQEDDNDVSKFIDVSAISTNATDLAGSFQERMRRKIFTTLASKSPLGGKTEHDLNRTLRDDINSFVNSWLLGGVLEGDNGCRVLHAGVVGDNFVIEYTSPRKTFQPAVPPGWPAGQANPGFDFSQGTLANIDHIVVVTMENRSFDHMLGYLSLPAGMGGMGRADIDGLKGTEVNVFKDQIIHSFPFPPQDTIFTPDPPHGTEPVANAINGGKMDGFVLSYAEERGPTVAPRIMGYYWGAQLPVYDALARDFAVGHRWFASHPGPTFCNRFYETTGRLNLDPDGFWEFDNPSPLVPVFTRSIFDDLSDQHVSWKYFENAYCFLRFFEKYTFDSTDIVSFDDPVWGFVHLAQSGALPSVSFIDPHFIELPPGGNDDGPPADVGPGQKFIQKIVEAVVTSPKWNKTLLIITYDEHGGFYDHVPPPKAPKVSPDLPIETFGIRVPVFVVSPWVGQGTVFGHDAGPGNKPSLYFDHTSILKTIARRFMSRRPPYYGARYEKANDLSAVLGTELRPSQFLPFIGYNLVYAESQKRLEVQSGAATPGTPLRQNDPSIGDPQLFSFEDAGDGFVYIRTHTGRLYVTVAADSSIMEDVKYQPGGPPGHDPNRQRWKFSGSPIVSIHRDFFTVSNAAFPGKVLQPANNSKISGSVVVLGDPEPTHVLTQLKNPWQVTSPLLGGGTVVTPT